MRVIRSIAPLMALVVLSLPGCGSDSDGNGPPAGDDLEVVSVHPADGSVQADANSPVAVVFDRALSPATILPTAFTITGGGQTLVTLLSYNSGNHSITMDAPLLPDEDYQAVVKTSVSGLGGERLPAEYQWDFSTRAWEEAGLGAVNGSKATALLADPVGTLHLLFWEAIAGPRDLLHYGSCTSQCESALSWTLVPLDTANSGGPVAITIGSSGEVAIAYQLSSSADLRFGLCAAGCGSPAGWQLTTLGLVPGNEGYSMVGLAAEGSGFHILTGVGNGAIIELVYAGCPGSCAVAGNWSFNTADPHSLGAGSLARSRDGTLHVLYNVTDNGAKLRYASCIVSCLVTANWQFIDLGSSAGNPALIADAAGELHAVVSRSARVNYLHCPGPCLNSNQWSSTEVDTYQSGPPHAAIAKDPDGRLHLVDANDDSQQLRYATCVTACTSPGSWQVKGARPGTTMRHPQVVVDAAGFVHSVFEDLGSSMLKVAQ